MRKTNVCSRLLSLVLCVCMVLGFLPAITPVVEVEAASMPTYIASIAVSYGAKESTPKDILTKNGYTVINKDLNGGCGALSDYVYMGYKTTTDPSKAITGIFFRVGGSPPNSATFDGVGIMIFTITVPPSR